MSVPQLKLLANKPFAEPDTVLAQVIFPSGYSYTTSVGGQEIPIAAADIELSALSAPAAGPNNQLPLAVGTIDQGTDGYYTEWVPGTTLLNGALRLWQPGGSEVGSGTLGAPWTNTSPPCVVVLAIHLNPEDQ